MKKVSAILFLFSLLLWTTTAYAINVHMCEFDYSWPEYQVAMISLKLGKEIVPVDEDLIMIAKMAYENTGGVTPKGFSSYVKYVRTLTDEHNLYKSRCLYVMNIPVTENEFSQRKAIEKAINIKQPFNHGFGYYEGENYITFIFVR